MLASPRRTIHKPRRPGRRRRPVNFFSKQYNFQLFVTVTIFRTDVLRHSSEVVSAYMSDRQRASSETCTNERPHTPPKHLPSLKLFSPPPALSNRSEVTALEPEFRPHPLIRLSKDLI
jgi:hypothetical protein